MSEKKRQALADWVIVKPFDANEKTEGGLFLPEQSKKRPNKGTVVHVGNGNGVDYELTLKEGDTVIYPSNTGTEIELDGELYMYMKEGNVIVVEL